MHTFKAGDRIRLKPNAPEAVDITHGAIYTVTGVDSDGNLEFLDDAGGERYRDAYDYEQVQSEAPFDLLAAMTGKPLRFRSGCDVRFVAYIPDAKPHCQLVLLNPATGNVVTRYANGKGSTEPYDEPGDILIAA
ncbi:hypothetical protein R6138_04569 [Ralstonia thomasii]|uniref:hypothetical protein n=1 Tax=Ralstonia thomasii TaxID=3058596 RepID=UPI0028F6AB58|nr:hypothetical protein [Ralstonia sp. LMG 18095]CAJ0901352.1 hypothetical protein R6138_04569 [Ralstonia sp. LMG 18095]